FGAIGCRLILPTSDEIIGAMKTLSFLLFLAVLAASCAAPGQVGVNTPQQQSINYPPTIEGSSARQQAAQDAWKRFLAERQLPEVKLDVEPVLNTPHALPMELAGRININTKNTPPGKFGETEVKEALRQFIDL